MAKARWKNYEDRIFEHEAEIERLKQLRDCDEIAKEVIKLIRKCSNKHLLEKIQQQLIEDRNKI